MLWLTVIGVVLAALTAWLAWWYPRKNLQLAKEQIEHESYASLHAQFFPHASLRAAIEVSNLGKTPVVVKAVRVTTTAISNAPIEISSRDLVVAAGDSRALGVFRELKHYREKYLSSGDENNVKSD
jgi:hypothetical protein